MKGNNKLFTGLNQLLMDKLIANNITAKVSKHFHNITAKVSKHFRNSAEEIQQSKNTKISLIDSEQTIKGEHYEGE